MQSEFQNCLNVARRRVDAAILVNRLGLVLTAAGAVALASLLLQRVLSVPLVTWPAAAALAALAAAAVPLLWFLRRPGRMQVALALDERMALRERFSTTLAMAASTDPFALAARQEAYAKAPGLDVSRHFPVRLGRGWSWAAPCWAAVGLVALFMPQYDLLGREAAARLLAQEDERARQAADDVKRTHRRVEALVKQLDLPDVAAEVAQLADVGSDASPEEIRREAIRRLGDVADKLQEAGSGNRSEAARMLEQQMRQLKLPSAGLSRKFGQALARGRYGDAAKALSQIQEQLARGDMKPEDREALAKELEALARQLQALANRQKELEDALAAAGCDRALAGLSPEALRRALEKAGVDSQTLQRLLQKQQAGQLASGQCSALADALSRCAGAGAGAAGEPFSGDAVAALENQLSQLEAMRQQLALLRATLDELYAGAASLGEGLGGTGLFAPGDLDGQGQGTGNRGQGNGPVETQADTPTSTLGTRVTGQTQAGPVVATWYSQEQQVAGEATRPFQEALQAGKDRAAEAVSENVIPSRYHESVKRYFETVGKQDP